MNNLAIRYHKPQIKSSQSTQRVQSSAFTMYEMAAPLRLGTWMARIGRIFTDTNNPCVSAQSVFHPIARINHMNGGAL